MLLIVKDNKRLCKDGHWREFAMFGTYQSCVKTYRRLGSAQKQAERVGGVVCKLPEDWEIDSCGICYKDVPSEKPGWVKTLKKNILDFQVSPAAA